MSTDSSDDRHQHKLGKRKARGRLSATRFFKKFLFLCILLGLSLLLVEVFLRCVRFTSIKPLIGVSHRTVEYGPFLPDRTRFWRLTPSYAPTEVNSQGFRGPEVSEPKPDNVYRIVCLGNSCCYGWKVPHQVAYPAVLEKMLNERERPRKVEVINAGVPGYSSLQELRYLTEELVKYDPDMVIVQYGENDEEGPNEQQEVPSALAFNLGNMLQMTRVGQLLYGSYYGMKRQRFHRHREYREEIIDKSYMDCYENLLDMEACARQNNFKIYFLTPTWLIAGELNRQERFTKDPRIDIFDLLNESGIPPESLYMDVHHWTPAGHALVAEAIYKAIYWDVQ